MSPGHLLCFWTHLCPCLRCLLSLFLWNALWACINLIKDIFQYLYYTALQKCKLLTMNKCISLCSDATNLSSSNYSPQLFVLTYACMLRSSQGAAKPPIWEMEDRIGGSKNSRFCMLTQSLFCHKQPDGLKPATYRTEVCWCPEVSSKHEPSNSIIFTPVWAWRLQAPINSLEQQMVGGGEPH